jgi:hypothetical protein
MGYTTTFKGELTFVQEPTASQLAKIKQLFKVDGRKVGLNEATYINLKFTEAFTGIEWNGTEKTYGMVEAVNYIIAQMKFDYPDFGLYGKLLAQGEDIEDRWELQINTDGWAVEKKIPLIGQKVRCPHCHNDFTLEA